MPHSLFCTKCWDSWTRENIDTVVEAVEKWTEDHSPKTRLTEYKKLFPDSRIRRNGYPSVDPCSISVHYDDEMCSKMIDCDKCRKEYWDEEIE